MVLRLHAPNTPAISQHVGRQHRGNPKSMLSCHFMVLRLLSRLARNLGPIPGQYCRVIVWPFACTTHKFPIMFQHAGLACWGGYVKSMLASNGPPSASTDRIHIISQQVGLLYAGSSKPSFACGFIVPALVCTEPSFFAKM